MISVEKFMATIIKAAAKGHNQTMVARKLRISQPAVSLRIKNLRKRGIKVPNINHGKQGEWPNMTAEERLIAAYK